MIPARGGVPQPGSFAELDTAASGTHNGQLGSGAFGGPGRVGRMQPHRGCREHAGGPLASRLPSLPAQRAPSAPAQRARPAPSAQLARPAPPAQLARPAPSAQLARPASPPSWPMPHFRPAADPCSSRRVVISIEVLIRIEDTLAAGGARPQPRTRRHRRSAAAGAPVCAGNPVRAENPISAEKASIRPRHSPYPRRNLTHGYLGIPSLVSRDVLLVLRSWLLASSRSIALDSRDQGPHAGARTTCKFSGRKRGVQT